MEKWIGKVAVVTGASSGIGKDIAIKLVEHGLRVVGCGRNFDALVKVRGEIPKGLRGEFTAFKCDVSKEEDVLSLFSFVNTNFKELSILINNAALGSDGSILHGKTENWKTMFETNVLGLCMCTREAFALMQRNEVSEDSRHASPGHIININSISGRKVYPYAFFHFYASTKFAVTAITEGIRQELREAKSNVRVTQLCPGCVDTEFMIRAGGEKLLKGLKEAQIDASALQASDISEAIIFILSADPRSAVHDIIIQPSTQAY